jgi:3-dehydroquinate synthase
MNKITVKASSKYDIFIGTGLLSKIGDFIKDVKEIKNVQKIVIVTDDIVAPFYLDVVENNLTFAGYDAKNYIIENGEKSKSATEYIKLLNFLAEEHLTRSDLIIALGGGVVGDLTGFVASSYLRGINFVQIPTTLLAAVDSSVGGKTAINLQSGKNLAGAFYQPKLVLCDYLTLDTLPDEIFKEGCGEVIKYGILGDENLFIHLERYLLDFDREYVISSCVELKKNIVNKDEFDNTVRQLLNLGHTVGHAIEKLNDYKVFHGDAVATGIAIITRLARDLEICDEKSAERILNLLTQFGFEKDTDFDVDEITEVILSDKKIRGNKINLILPKKIGECIIKEFDVDEIPILLKSALRG